MNVRKRIFITGRIQGVGFRPAVYRLAKQLNLTGFIYNDTKGVTIEAQGETEVITKFVHNLGQDSKVTPLTQIKSCKTVDIPLTESEEEFAIKSSERAGTALSQVSPDIAVCEDCLGEMRDPSNFRYRYPFINCTNCGPRYSIVKTIPYDRPNTTMSEFKMCGKCSAQYKNPSDRRFHAQPVACPQCGPKIWLTDNTGKIIEKNSDAVIKQTAQMLLDGKIAAIKGIGGFHLAVNALDNEAVLRLRLRKKRDAKPFAMMTDSVEKIKKYAVVGEIEQEVLKSPESPIVLLPKKPNSLIASAAAEGVNSYGFMLCYAPLHWLLFEQGPEVLVMTSGNISDEPLICENEAALEKLSEAADVFLMHNRKIYRQVDDSIVHFINNEPVLLRRARGYVPTPIIAKTVSQKDILATGSDLKNTFSYVKSNQLIVSEHIGDMEDASVYRHYVKSINHLEKLFEVEPQIIACDLHPGYFSSQYAGSLKNAKFVKIQHHWAHIASVLAEYELDEKVIGLECDGTGYGTDGAVWGCECLIADLENFERFGHLAYYPLAGGDLASKEAIRPVIALLSQAYGDEFDLSKFVGLLEKIEPNIEKQKLIWEQIRKKINTVNTSSLGRVFDAAAAIAGLGNYNHFEAQLPMAFEACADDTNEQRYDFDIINIAEEPVQLDLRRMIRQLVADAQKQRSCSEISAKFHNCIAAGLCAMAKKARDMSKLNKVALSGGVFCNRYLTNRLIQYLNQADFVVLFNRYVPSNDGGISLGQAVIAAKQSSRH
ncbi:MAG: carbamoyltransferase HypF [Phycisphaerae bacterium]